MCCPNNKDQINIARTILRGYKTAVDNDRSDQSTCLSILNKCLQLVEQATAPIRALELAKSLLNLLQQTIVNALGKKALGVEVGYRHCLYFRGIAKSPFRSRHT